MNKRTICNIDYKQFAANLIAKAKNGPRALFRQTHDTGAVIEVTWADVPADGQNYVKIMRHYPETLWGIYDSRAKPEWIVSDLNYSKS